MNTYSVFDRRKANLAAAFTLLLALVAPAALPAFASADQLTGRSIQLSNSAAGATNASYQVDFTVVDDAAAYTIDFCTNSSVIGATCTAPNAPFDVTDVATSTSGATVSAPSSSRVKVVQAIDASADSTVSTVLTGIDNPGTAGNLYARIVTYASSTGTIDTATADAPGTHVDDGGVAISITNEIGVSAAVMETMTFCVSAADPDANCAGTSAPNVSLGNATTGLASNTVSEGQLYTQISTNAAGGAVVNLKSNATGCGGLKRAGAPNGTCDITPAATNFAAGEAKFGSKVEAVTGGTGTFQASGNYNASTWFLGFDEDEETGVTSTYGDPILNTNNTVADNKEAIVKFGASISNATPAGSYSAQLSMIATGKF